jgi:hypothetical protein
LSAFPDKLSVRSNKRALRRRVEQAVPKMGGVGWTRQSMVVPITWH